MRLLDFFCRFVTGASVGLLCLLLLDAIVGPGIFLDSDRLLLGCAILTGAVGTIVIPGACDA
jgi:hypothetical protein